MKQAKDMRTRTRTQRTGCARHDRRVATILLGATLMIAFAACEHFRYTTGATLCLFSKAIR